MSEIACLQQLHEYFPNPPSEQHQEETRKTFECVFQESGIHQRRPESRIPKAALKIFLTPLRA
jgi:hypothetical protein